MKLVWDQIGQKRYETGVDHAVYYPINDDGEYTPGVAWNGVTSISETPEGAEPESQYADNIKYLTMISAEELNGTIEAFTYPREFAQSNGEVELTSGIVIGQQNRKIFGLSYRTKVGDDIRGQDSGYKLHLIYGALCSPSERTYETLNDSPEAITFSWEFSTTPVPVTDRNPTSILTIDTTLLSEEEVKNLATLEEVLYGKDGEDPENAPRLPLPDEVLSIMTTGSIALSASVREAGRAAVLSNH